MTAVERKSNADVEKDVINWKFASLDTDGDASLSRREFKVLRQLIKKV